MQPYYYKPNPNLICFVDMEDAVFPAMIDMHQNSLENCREVIRTMMVQHPDQLVEMEPALARFYLRAAGRVSRGRPRSDNPKSVSLAIRFAPDEVEALRLSAAANSMSVSEFVRSAIFGADGD